MNTARENDSPSLQNEDISILKNLAANYFTEGKFMEAMAAFHQAMTLEPDFAKVYHSLGTTLLNLGKVERAISCYSLAAEINPNFVENLTILAKCLMQLGRLDEAQKNYQKALSLNPKLADAYLNLGRIFFAQNRQIDALQSWLKISEINPEIISGDSWFKLGNNFEDTGKIEAAIACYQQVILRQPKQLQAYLNLWLNLEKKGQIREAIACCFKALTIQPYFETAYHSLYQLFQKLGRTDDANNCYFRNVSLKLIEEFIGEKISVISSEFYSSKAVLVPKINSYQNLDVNYLKSGYGNQKAFVTIIPNGRGWADIHTRAIIDSENHIFEQFSLGSPGLISLCQDLPLPEKFPGTVAFLSRNYCYNYYHWLFNFLPQLELISCCGLELKNIDFFLVNDYNLPFQKETINLLGVSENKIIESSKYPHIIAEKLIVTTPLFESTQWACQFLRREFLHPLGIKVARTERIYISRKKSRRLVNEEELLALISQLGFRIVIPESLSVVEQISLFATAEVVIATHGAALANLVFCGPGTKVIEILTPKYVNPCYQKLSSQVGLEYYSLLGENCEPQTSGTSQETQTKIHSIYEDIKIDLNSTFDLMKLAKVI